MDVNGLSVIDLIHGDSYGVMFQTSIYPDSQIGGELQGDLCGNDVLIKSRLSSFDDLQQIMVVVSACREANAGKISLRVPYFIGARSDRRFSKFGCHYLKDVICPVINSLGFHKVFILDPHSDVLPSLLDNVVIESNSDFHFRAGAAIGTDAIVLSPDAGAQKRAMEYAKVNYSPQIVYCTKNRDVATGKITETNIPVDSFGGSNVVIVDDICDGGATFLNLGRQVRERKCGRLYLVVTHGIFSAGFHLLEGVFDRILCTDSYSKTEHPLVMQFKA